MCLIADTVKRASDLSRGCRAFELSPICRIDGQESLVTVPVPQQNSKGKSKSLRLKYICYVLQARWRAEKEPVDEEDSASIDVTSCISMHSSMRGCFLLDKIIHGYGVIEMRQGISGVWYIMEL
ncbi:hypothetical protein V6N13_018105 [Hibiscus sabdariffa]